MTSEREEQIAAGTVLITSRELAPRLGLGGKSGWRRVNARAKAGRLPVVMFGNKPRFHWPTVVEVLNRRRRI